MEWYHIVLIVYISTHLLTFIMWIAAAEYDDTWLWPWLLPKTIYDSISVNWFGAIFLYIIYFVTTPLYAIGTFIYWCCIVGRK
jgi:formate/nitrite transporter FocA (FNT family)